MSTHGPDPILPRRRRDKENIFLVQRMVVVVFAGWELEAHGLVLGSRFDYVSVTVLQKGVVVAFAGWVPEAHGLVLGSRFDYVSVTVLQKGVVRSLDNLLFVLCTRVVRELKDS